MNNQVIDAIIGYLEYKSNLTDYEKDIIDSYRELNKFPEDRNSILKQLHKNKKYNIEKEELLLAAERTNMNVVIKPIYQLSNDELKSNLYNQLLILCSKYKP